MPNEDPNSRSISFYLDIDLLAKLDKIATKEGRSRSALIRFVLVRYLEWYARKENAS